ncbi:MAG: hypothetical protein F6K21_12785 [Symploca sp. SIO2D2]|nr:hypothetical protein [Symploca sp. SIO2D2]
MADKWQHEPILSRKQKEYCLLMSGRRYTAQSIKPPVPLQVHQPYQSVCVFFAQLGGFLGRKSDGEPGVKTLWRGIQRLNDLAAMWQILANS